MSKNKKKKLKTPDYNIEFIDSISHAEIGFTKVKYGDGAFAYWTEPENENTDEVEEIDEEE